MIINGQLQMSDEKLVQSFLEGNREAMGIIYQRHYQKVFYLLMSIVKDGENSLDLTHDVFLKVFESLSSFRGDSMFSTWLYSVTRNYGLEYLRKQQRLKTERIDSDIQIQEEEASYEETALYNIKSEIIQREFNKNPDAEHNILFQKYIMQLSIRDIQDKLDLSESAVKMRLKRARQKIAQKIQYLPEAV